MLRVLSDLNNVERFDVEASVNLIASGVTGTFVSKLGDTLDLPTAGANGVFQVFTESSRDGAAGKWSPDFNASGYSYLSVLFGKYRALTDQYSGTPAAGNLLKVLATGKLSADSVTANQAVAVCTKAAHSIEHLGTSFTVIEYVTI
jgi:hypothetical protein